MNKKQFMDKNNIEFSYYERNYKNESLTINIRNAGRFSKFKL